MKRNIISIDSDKCNGCGLCINACHEGALALVNGKAQLISESYCDGLGNCLPECPTGAITIEEREAQMFNEKAVQENITKAQLHKEPIACGCPGTFARAIENKPEIAVEKAPNIRTESQLKQWPVQIKLVSPQAPYFENAHLLVAADCTAFAYANFHEDFIKNKIAIIGCPKLDETDYSEKLAAILSINNIKSVTVVRMEVPCCGGIVSAVMQALQKSGKIIPWTVTVIGIDGKKIDN